ncbi:MAG: FHA domain-containing protein [Deltaproteobacteria bacterium]|nr:FHA domain-containing protein [Deltaproteobacteria bacterium]
MLARFDVANLLIYLDELIVIAARIIEIPPKGAAPGAPSGPNLLGREVVSEFIDNAGELVRIFVAELKEEMKRPEVDVSAFHSQLKQLGRLYQFSVLFDDEDNRSRLHALTEGVRSSVKDLSESIKKRLHVTKGNSDAVTEQTDMLQKQLTIIYELAEELGWIGFCQSLMTDLRNRFLVGAEGNLGISGDRRDEKILPEDDITTGEGSADSKSEILIPPRAQLVCLDDSFFPGAGNGPVIRLMDLPVSIGRDTDAGVVIESDQISRKHARLNPAGDTWAVEDLKSANGVRVNDERITNKRLTPGDIICFGPIPFRYEIVAPEIPDRDPEMTTFADLDEPAADVTLMYSDVRSSRAMMEALEKEDKGEAVPRKEISGEGKTMPFPQARPEMPVRRRSGALGRFLGRVIILAVVFGMGFGGHHYYQNVYKVKKAREKAIKRHSGAIKQFSDEFETYGKFDQRSHRKQVSTLTKLLTNLDREIKNYPDIDELKVLDATLRFMILERKVRFLLEEKTAQQAFGLIDRARAKLNSAHSMAENPSNETSKTLRQINDLMALLRVVSHYKLFQQKYSDPYEFDEEEITDQVIADVIKARKWKHEFIALKKENSMALSVKFRYLGGMVSEVEEYGITLVNRWYHHLSSKDNP